MATEPGGVCWLCQQPSNIVCPQCNFAEYCSLQCAEDDRPEHEEECAEAATAELPCAYCGRLSRHLARCRRCHLVAYCSSSCYHLDTRLHLPTCLAGRDAVLRVANSLTHGAVPFRLPVYFGGGPHALNLLKGVDGSGEEPFRLLQLSGQLHHLLRTAAGVAGSRRPLSVTLASDSPHQLARACLLLHLLTGAGPAAAVQVMYSLRLETSTAQQLHAALEQLVSATYSQLLQLLPWLQLGRAALSHWQEVWRAWLYAMQDASCLQRMLACQEAVMQQEVTRANLQRYLAALPARQQRAARQLLTQHSCLLTGERARAADTANVTLLALSPRDQRNREEFGDLRLGAQPPAWLEAAGDATTVLAPAPPPGPLGDWDAAEVVGALGAECDVISGCLQLAEDCAAALQQRAAHGRLSVRLVQFDTLEELDDQLSELRFERIFTADATDRLGLFSVLEMCEVLLATVPRALIVTSHSRWAALSLPADSSVSTLRGGGTLAWDRQMDTGRFRLTAYLQAARLAYMAAAREKDVLDARLTVPTTLEVSTFGTLLLTDPGRQLLTVAPHRFRRAPRTVSVADTHLRMLEWRRDPEGVRRQLAENRAQLAAEQPVVTRSDTPLPNVRHRGPGQYERWVQERPVSDQPPPAPLQSPVYGSIRRRAGSAPSRRRMAKSAAAEPASCAQHMSPYSLYENLSTLKLASQTQSLKSPRPPPTPVMRTGSMLVGASLRRRERAGRAATDVPLYETLSAVRQAMPSPPADNPFSVPSTPLSNQNREFTMDFEQESPERAYFRRSASLRAMRRPPGSPQRRLPTTAGLPSPAGWHSNQWPSPPNASYNQSPTTVGVTENGQPTFSPWSKDQRMTPISQPQISSAPRPTQRRSKGSVTSAYDGAQVDEEDGPFLRSPPSSPHSAALQTPEGRRRLVECFVFPPKRQQKSDTLYGSLLRRTASLSLQDRRKLETTLPRHRTELSRNANAPLESPLIRQRRSLDERAAGVVTQPHQTPMSAPASSHDHESARDSNRVRSLTPVKSAPAPPHEVNSVKYGSSSSESNTTSETVGVAAAVVKSPEEIDRMTQRREPKNISDWLLEDKERQREFEQHLVPTTTSRQWVRQDTPPVPPASAPEGTTSSGSDGSTPQTRPGRITPASSVAESGIAASRRRAFRARGARTTERLLASLERDWSLDVPETMAAEMEREPQTIAELGVRDEVAQWLLDHLLQDQVRELSVEWLDERVTDALEDANTTKQEEKPSSTELECSQTSVSVKERSLAPKAVLVDTPAPKDNTPGPFDINAQEVGKLQSPRFPMIDTPAPKMISRESFFAEMRQYMSPITGNQLVTLRTSEDQEKDDSGTPSKEPVHSASVYIPSPEQCIVIPIPCESADLQPPAIQVPNALGPPVAKYNIQGVKSMTNAGDNTQEQNTGENTQKSVVLPKPISPLAKRRQNSAKKTREFHNHAPSTLPDTGSTPSDEAESTMNQTVPAPQPTKADRPAPIPRRVTPSLTTTLPHSDQISQIEQVRSSVDDQTPEPATADDERTRLLGLRRARLMERAASQPLFVGSTTAHPSDKSIESAELRGQPDGHTAGSDQVSRNSSSSQATSNDNRTSSTVRYTASAKIAPNQVSANQQMLWKIPPIERKSKEGDSDGVKQTEHEDGVNGQWVSNSNETTHLTEEDSVVIREKQPTPSEPKRRSRKLSMDKEYYEMKQKLAMAELPVSVADSSSNSTITGPQKRLSRPLSMDVEYSEMKQKLQQLNSATAEGSKSSDPPRSLQTTPVKPGTPLQRTLSMEQELFRRAGQLQPVPTAATLPASPLGQFVRTGSVRQRAALFSQLVPTPEHRPCLSLSVAPEPPYSPFTRLQPAEAAPARAEITVQLQRSPTPSPKSPPPYSAPQSAETKFDQRAG